MTLGFALRLSTDELRERDWISLLSLIFFLRLVIKAEPRRLDAPPVRLFLLLLFAVLVVLSHSASCHPNDSPTHDIWPAFFSGWSLRETCTYIIKCSSGPHAINQIGGQRHPCLCVVVFFLSFFFHALKLEGIKRNWTLFLMCYFLLFLG